MEEPCSRKDPAKSMAELSAALNDMRDAFVKMSLLMKDQLFELEARQGAQHLAELPPPVTGSDPLP